MVAITRKVAELGSSIRRALEDATGMKLRDEQDITIQIGEPQESQSPTRASSPAGQLPEWCQVYSGLSDEEIAAMDGILRDRLSLS